MVCKACEVKTLYRRLRPPWSGDAKERAPDDLNTFWQRYPASTVPAEARHVSWDLWSQFITSPRLGRFGEDRIGGFTV